MSLDDQVKVEQGLTEITEHVYKNFLRKLQADAYRCSMVCYERPNGTQRRDQECEESCIGNPARAMQITNRILKEYQDSLQTCIRKCTDDARYSNSGDRLSPETEKKLTECASKCVSSFLSKKERVLKDLTESLKSI